jgi:hypothetical protein
VTAEDDFWSKRSQLSARRAQSQEGVDGQSLIPCSKVRRGAERIRTGEHPPAWPPERDLVPRAAVLDGKAGERTERASRNYVVANAEPRGEGSAVAVVPVEQLDNARGCAGRTNPFLDVLSIYRIDHPDAAVHDEGVRAPLHELVDNPAEARVELVAETNLHSGESTDGVSGRRP